MKTKIDRESTSLFLSKECWNNLNCLANLKSRKRKHPEMLFQEIISSGADNFEFLDYANLDNAKILQLCDLLIKNKKSIKWTCLIYPGVALSEKVLIKMKEAGCTKLIFDIFSGSDRLLRQIKAGFVLQDVVSAFQKTKKLGLSTAIRLLIGHPKEKTEDFACTLEFLRINKGLIDEISEVNFCLSVCLFELYRENNLCHSWRKCLGEDTQPIKRNFKDFNGELDKINSIGIPVESKLSDKSCWEAIDDSSSLWQARKGKLFFSFEQGKGHIFYDNLKLTKEFGVYTSIFAHGKWNDSEQAVWSSVVQNDSRIILTGAWKELPIKQIWTIEVIDEGLISVLIEIEFLERFIIEGEQQLNIMFIDNYDKWSFLDGEQFVFNRPFDHLWNTFFVKETSNVNKVSLYGNNKLPAVSLRSVDSLLDDKIAILNTSVDFSARKLKLFRINEKNYLPGRQPYFKAEIIIRG